MGFVERWANFVRTHPDEEWGRQQNILINTFLRNVKQLSPREYLELKGEKCSR